MYNMIKTNTVNISTGGSSNFVTLGKSDDIFRESGGILPRKCFEFWILNRINFKKHFVQVITFIKY